jgi:hypothetical protein
MIPMLTKAAGKNTLLMIIISHCCVCKIYYSFHIHTHSGGVIGHQAAAPAATRQVQKKNQDDENMFDDVLDLSD